MLFRSDFVGRPPIAALITDFELQKVVGDADLTSSPHSLNLADLWRQHEENELKVIELLTLILEKQVQPVGTVTEPTSGFNGTRQFQKQYLGNSWSIQPEPFHKQHVLRFQRLWPVLTMRKKNSRNFLAIAMRRFFLATSRTSLEDSLIDLTICAEALLLRSDHGELTYKLSHRAALLLGGNPQERKSIFQFFNSAYAMRSKVVHGSNSFMSDPKDVAALTKTIAELTMHLRTAILTMLAMASNPHATDELIDWKDLMFTEPHGTRATPAKEV